MTGNSTVFLTGATGLVGRFLLAGLLRRRVPTIALVRSQPHRTARERIEEALLPFETDVALPRPILVEGDLSQPSLGLSAAHQALLAGQPLRILHSAASIRFHADTPTSEPYATNVAGTKHLLGAAADWQVTQFHHVSTAYVQCDRQSGQTALEVPVADENNAGNDYERSKILSERLIRQCPHLGIQTFYRPSIVVGDSVTGYTSTFHGFYAPLQIAMTLVRAMGLPPDTADRFRQHLGLNRHDSKNLVPVDWLAAAILHLVHTPAAHGGIYHLTHPQPATLQDMQSAIADAIREAPLPPKSSVVAEAGSATVEQRGVENGNSNFAPPTADAEAFRSQLAVYESYFLNDPSFDRSRVSPFLKDLPCPAMDYATLKKLATFAIRNNFGWPRPRVTLGHASLHLLNEPNGGMVHSRERLEDVHVVLELLGPTSVGLDGSTPPIFCRQAGQWRTIPVLSSSANGDVLRLVTTEQSLRMAVAGKVEPGDLFAQGRWIIRGQLRGDWLEILRDWVQHVSMSNVENPA